MLTPAMDRGRGAAMESPNWGKVESCGGLPNPVAVGYPVSGRLSAPGFSGPKRVNSAMHDISTKCLRWVSPVLGATTIGLASAALFADERAGAPPFS